MLASELVDINLISEQIDSETRDKTRDGDQPEKTLPTNYIKLEETQSFGEFSLLSKK